MVCARKTIFLAVLVFSLTAPLTLLAQAPKAPAPGQTAPDISAEEVTLTPKTIIYIKGAGIWDTGFETLLDAFKTLYGVIEKQGLKAAGPAMTIITEFDDINFRFQAAVPITEEPANFPRGDISIGKSPEGKAYKFVHRGAYNKTMDTLFGAIADYFEEKRLEARDFYVEEFASDVLTTPPDKLVVHVFMPVK
jgi:effector-binding domain-containing protein